jgi:hypothetical protein
MSLSIGPEKVKDGISKNICFCWQLGFAGRPVCPFDVKVNGLVELTFRHAASQGY